jgi:prepilin-type N-terminal cleavage/methylation domain-containing protein
MNRKKRRQRGFSMLEIIVTVFLVTLGLLVVMTSFVAIGKAHRYSERMDVAASLARLEMERIRNQTYANVQSQIGAYTEYPEHPDYRHEVAVADLGNVKQVTLRIYFENDRRRTEVITYVSNL